MKETISRATLNELTLMLSDRFIGTLFITNDELNAHPVIRIYFNSIMVPDCVVNVSFSCDDYATAKELYPIATKFIENEIEKNFLRKYK